MLRGHGLLRESTDSKLKDDICKSQEDLNPQFIFTTPGFNARNNEIGALIGKNQLLRLDTIVQKRAENFEYFLKQSPDWLFKDFDLSGQSNYALNIILENPDPKKMQKLCDTLTREKIEFRRGSAGGGNQLRQPYISVFDNCANLDPASYAPVSDHVHFYGLYIGNHPDVTKDELDWICAVLKEV